MSKATQLVSRLLVYSGLAAVCYRLRRTSRTPRLTILTYHRIGEADGEGEYTDPQMISATPEGFDWQMDYLSRRFTVLPLEEVIGRYRSKQPMPANMAAITFDDGYQDNYSLAYPILRRYHLPATIFLTTGFISSTADTTNNQWWDALVYLIATTQKSAISVNGLGRLRLESAAERGQAREKLRRHFKSLNDGDRRVQVERLKQELCPGGDCPMHTPLPLTWDEVCKMSFNGISFGAHTHTHPILTRVTPEEAGNEIQLSKKIIERETGMPVRLFAYPNGKKTDFDARVREMVVASGFEAAVTLLHGSNRLTNGRVDRYTLRRIYVGSDDRATFVAKVSGALEMFASLSQRSGHPGY